MAINPSLNPVGIAQHAKDNDVHCGDLCASWHTDKQSTLLIVDGLGHGISAERASQKAYQYVQQHLDESIEAIFAGCDACISDTRGAAMAIVKIDHNDKKIKYIAIGNTEGILYSHNNYIHMTNQWGIVGTGITHFIPEIYPIDSGDCIILFTDGIDIHFDPDYYTARWGRVDAQVLADDIAIRWATHKDDVGVLVYQQE